MGAWHLAGRLLLAAFIGACSPAPSPYAGLADRLPGVAKDTREFNGLFASSQRVHAMDTLAVGPSGLPVRFARLRDGRIGALVNDGNTIIDADQLAGVTVYAALESGAPAKFRIDVGDTTAVPGVDLYVLSVFDGNTWSPACGTDPTGTYAPPGVPIPAIAVSETWDFKNGNSQFEPMRFTFSCINAAVGSCLIWGYKRWGRQVECLNPDDASTCNYRELLYVHQACMRMIRADYCGIGTSLTRGGASLDVYDAFGLRPRTGIADFSLEAEWQGDGAHCIHLTRFKKADPQQSPMDATDLDFITGNCAGRLAKDNPVCADPAASHFFTANGFSDSIFERPLLRTETTQR